MNSPIRSGSYSASLIPRTAPDRPRVSDRRVINGMVYTVRTGISWRDLPERYGPWQTVCTRFRRHAPHGVFTRALQRMQACADAAGDIDWLVQIDSCPALAVRQRRGPSSSVRPC
ncbi:transposase [Streptomyces sviceus]|uniref:transposase n=1 Tax=Streptomyces sviceus TaxID=285530 RepID=UPI003801F06B